MPTSGAVEPPVRREAGTSPPRAGFALLWDVFGAPQRAFETIAATSEWRLGLLAVVVATFGADALAAPAYHHMLMAEAAKRHDDSPVPGFLQIALSQSWYALASLLVTAAVLQMVTLLRGKRKPFWLLFSLAVNCSLPAYAGMVADGFVLRLRDPAAFSTYAQIVRAFPESLAAFVPKAGDVEAVFLANFDLFALWSLLLLAIGFVRLTGTSLAVSLILCFGITLGFALLTLTLPS